MTAKTQPDKPGRINPIPITIPLNSLIIQSVIIFWCFFLTLFAYYLFF